MESGSGGGFSKRKDNDRRYLFRKSNFRSIVRNSILDHISPPLISIVIESR